MLRYLTIILLCSFIVGCSDVPTDEQYKEATTWCDNFGGTKRVTFGELTGLRVRCGDGKLIIKDRSG